jgi:hypothetical protein
LIQYFTKGYCVAARKLTCLLKRMNVVIFQHMIKTPTAMPIMAALKGFTFPRYSGARKSASAPKSSMKELLATLNMINQKRINTWYFRKCKKTS